MASKQLLGLLSKGLPVYLSLLVLTSASAQNAPNVKFAKPGTTATSKAKRPNGKPFPQLPMAPVKRALGNNGRAGANANGPGDNVVNEPQTLSQRHALEQLRAGAEGQVIAKFRANAGTPNLIQGKLGKRFDGRVIDERDRAEKTARGFLKSHERLLRLNDGDGELKIEEIAPDE